MIAKIVQGSCFKGAINYVLDKEKAEYLASNGVRLTADRDRNAIIHSFITQAKFNPITKPVAHISLDFSAQDKAKLSDDMMLNIALEYLQKMGYKNTQMVAVRHHNTDHPHLHLIINRIGFDGKRISDQNERIRNMKVCKELTEKHGLYFSSGKENVKRHRLREPEKTKYDIYDSLVKNVPLSKSWAELERRLRADGIEVGFKTKGSTSQIEGVKFMANNLSFNGSKVDVRFSYSKIDFALRQNARAEDVQQRASHIPQVQSAEHNYTPNLITIVGSDDLFNQNPVFDPDEAEFERQQRLRKKKKRGRSM